MSKIIKNIEELNNLEVKYYKFFVSRIPRPINKAKAKEGFNLGFNIITTVKDFKGEKKWNVLFVVKNSMKDLT